MRTIQLSKAGAELELSLAKNAVNISLYVLPATAKGSALPDTYLSFN